MEWLPEERGAAWHLRSLATAHLPALAFQAACQADLFSLLELGPADPQAVAEGCQLHLDAAGYLLEALTALKLLERTPTGFINSPLASQMLVKGKPRCQLGVIAENTFTVRGLSRWTSALNLKTPGDRQSPDPDERLDALHASALPAAGPVVERLGLNGRERALDLGGGAGTYLLEMLRVAPDLEGSILELPELAAALRERVGQQLTVLEGDFLSSDLGTGYSLVLLSHVVNYLSREELPLLIARAAGALAPGGRLAVHDILLGGKRDALLMQALFSLRLMTENQGQGHSLGALRTAMAEAGLEGLEEHDLDPEPAHLLVGWKPC